ncbi:GNAT family N-acetyltransferase [Arthrobacter sp. NPDC056493]|uniref:GNAT family N-acetyltransferase n=1 Tax=Arthrobacter sp. NPDC056493 TaxID=3345839 RepID=UPI003670B2B7
MQDLSGSNIMLRPWRTEDAGFVYDLYSRRDVQRHLGHEPRVMERADEAQSLIERLRSRNDPVLGYWAVEAATTDTVVGTVMLQGIRQSGTRGPSDEVEVGWHFHPDARGHGYATEAARLVMGHAFESGLNRIIALAHVDNKASHRVCRRLGMRHEGPTLLRRRIRALIRGSPLPLI